MKKWEIAWYLNGQVTKGREWMPRCQKAKKAVVDDEMLREDVEQSVIRRLPNGETW